MDSRIARIGGDLVPDRQPGIAPPEQCSSLYVLVQIIYRSRIMPTNFRCESWHPTEAFPALAGFFRCADFCLASGFRICSGLPDSALDVNGDIICAADVVPVPDGRNSGKPVAANGVGCRIFLR